MNTHVEQTAQRQQEYKKFQPAPGAPSVDLETAMRDMMMRIDMMRPIIEPLIPSVPFSKFKEGVAMALAGNKGKLLEQSREHLINAIVRGAHWNLDPNPDLGFVYYVPRNGIVKAELGYSGMRELVMRDGLFRDMKAVLVYEKDHFYVEEVPEQKIEHRPLAFQDRGPLIGAYAVAWYKDGNHIRFDLCDLDYVNKIREGSKDTRPDSPWKMWPDQQILKTALKKLLRQLPKASVPADIAKAELHDDEDGEDLYEATSAPEPVAPPAPKNYTLKAETYYHGATGEPIVNVTTQPMERNELVEQEVIGGVIPPAPPIEVYEETLASYAADEAANSVSPTVVMPPPIVSAPIKPPGKQSPYSPPKEPVKKQKLQEVSSDLSSLFSGASVTENIIKFPGITTLDISASEMLLEIAKEEPANVFAIVWPNDGGLPSYHTSSSDMPVILMRLNQFIHDWYGGRFGDE